MPESSFIPTTTIVTILPNSPNIEIYTFYDEGDFHIISAFIASQVGSRLGITYKEGHLILTMRDSPSEVNCYIDNKGHLIVRSLLEEVYSIDSNGHLIGQKNV